MAQTMVRRVLLQIGADDGDTEEKLDAITAKANELRDMHPELTARIDTAEATAKMTALRAELRDVATGPVEITAEDQQAMDTVAALQARLDELRATVATARADVDDKDALATLLGLGAQLEALGDTISRPSISVAGLARAEADIAGVDARLDKLAEKTAKPDVDLQDTDALVRMADFQGRLAELGAKSADVGVKFDDKAARLEMLQFSAQLAALGEKTARPNVSLAGWARAEAELASLDLQMDKMKAKADASGAEGLIGKILTGRGGSGSGFLGGLVKWIPMVGDELSGLISKLGELGGKSGEEGASAAGEAGEAAEAGGPEGLAAVAGIIVSMVPVVAAAAAEADALASGLAAAAAGAGAFGLLAYPSVEKVTGALHDTKAQLDKLPEGERRAVEGLQGLESQWKSMSGKLSGGVYSDMDKLENMASTLMPKMMPFADTFQDKLSSGLSKLDKQLRSKGFDDFLSKLHSIEGPALGALGNGLDGLGRHLGRLLTMMSGKDVATGITFAFTLLDEAIDAVIWTVHTAMRTWDAFSRAIHTTAHDFDTARHSIASFGHDVASAFDSVRHSAASFGHDVAHDFDTARHDISSATDKIVNYVKGHWRQLTADMVDPIGSAVSEVRSHLHGFESGFDTARHDVASSLDDMRHDVSSDFDDVRHSIASFADWLPHEVASGFDDARHNAASALDDTRHDVASGFDDIRHSTASGVDDVVHYVEQLPGKIGGALSRLPGDLETDGRNAIDGLVRGIESAAGQIPGIMKGLAKDVEGYFTDPLKMFSPSRVMMEHGRNVPAGVALGITSGTGLVRQAVTHMANVVNRPLTAGAAALAGGGSAAGKIQLEVVGDSNQALVTLLKKNTRVRGGNSLVFGS